MSEQDDIDDLVGRPSSTRKRTREDLLEDLVSTQKQSRTYGGPMVEDMLQGVTVSWLAQVFGMDPKTVKQKLSGCPPLHRRKAGYVYHMPTACRYLIPPAISAEQYIKTMKPADLPTAFQQSFWDAALKRQKWEENAGQLWRTDRIRETLGTTFQTIKFTLQLWPDTLERQTGLTPEQRGLLTKLVDGLQEEIYKALVEQAASGKTLPQSGELDDMLGEASTSAMEGDIADLV